MTLHDILDYMVTKVQDFKDAAAGSFIYFLYGQVFHKKNIYKGITSFLIGTICAMYVAPQLYQWFPTFNYNFIIFTIGVVGTNLMEALITINWKQLFTKKINTFLGVSEKKD